MAGDPRHSERTEGPTPNGGVAAVAYWRDRDGNPTTGDKAVAVEIVELDAGGNQVGRTYGTLGPPGDRR